jgi:hypothetical protein
VTRLNLPDPPYLTDEHLGGERHEAPRVFALAAAWRARGCDTPIPPTFLLGPGHVTFFYTRLGWVARRYAALTAEWVARGFNATPLSLPLDGPDWTPTAADMAVSVARLREALGRSKRVQHFRGVVVGGGFYDNLEIA